MVPRALKEVLVQLSEIIPILNHSTVNTLLENAFAERFTGVVGLVFYDLANIIIDDVVEEVVVCV